MASTVWWIVLRAGTVQGTLELRSFVLGDTFALFVPVLLLFVLRGSIAWMARVSLLLARLEPIAQRALQAIGVVLLASTARIPAR